MPPFRPGKRGLTLEEAKSALRLDPDDPFAEEAAAKRVEDAFTDELTRALRKQRDALIPLTAAEEELIVAHSRIADASADVESTIYKWLLAAGLLGMTISHAQLGGTGIGFDWGVSEVDVAAWASRRTGELVRGINGTTQRRLQQAINDWLLSDRTVAELRRELTPIFGRQRAGMIAATETTRALGAAAEITYLSTGVVNEWQWVTSRDDRVCPVCSVNSDVIRPIGDSFPSGHTNVPAHVNCRCFVVPWVPNV